MTKIAFKEKVGLNYANKDKLIVVNEIINEYADQGYRMTLRQLYYQLVSRDIIPNEDKEYAKLSSLLVKGRMGGAVDWDAIEDRLRIPYLPYWVDGIDGAIDDTITQYRLDRQADQDTYIELWVEKDALSNVLRRVSSHYHINLVVNRGYSSCTAMYDAYKRVARSQTAGSVILYLGDHDPSGLDMIRDIRDRLDEFGANAEVLHIGLTKKQIEEYDPPPNPAKWKDPRAKWYMKKHGQVSWEVDALRPEILEGIVRKNIEKYMDLKKFKEVLKVEKKHKEMLTEFKNSYEDKGE